MLVLAKQRTDIVITNRHAKDFDVVDTHAVLFEEAARAFLVVFTLHTKNGVTDDVGGVVRDLLDTVSFHSVPDQRSEVIGQELDIVLDLEPVLRLTLEVHPVAQGDLDGNQI